MPADLTPIPADDMYKTRYFEIADLLDEVLGDDEEVRTGEGIVQDVHLLARLQQEAARRADATRQMANEANARLRSLLLAALGIEDDDKTSLTGYVNALIADRDGALERGRTAAAADIRAEIVDGRLPTLAAMNAAYEHAARIAENGADQ